MKRSVQTLLAANCDISRYIPALKKCQDDQHSSQVEQRILLTCTYIAALVSSHKISRKCKNAKINVTFILGVLMVILSCTKRDREYVPPEDPSKFVVPISKIVPDFIEYMPNRKGQSLALVLLSSTKRECGYVHTEDP
jgi:hypothetical protein